MTMNKPPAKACNDYTAPMRPEEIEALAKLLVRFHNGITPDRCSIYGAAMDKALCRDLYNTLYIFFDQCDRFCEIRQNFTHGETPNHTTLTND